MKAKKSYGQHFLINQHLILKIVDQIKEHCGDLPLLEVGPGRGALTEHLIDAEDFKCVEADREMVDVLKEKFPQREASIHQADFIKWPIAQYLDVPHALIGNFPYNISTQIVFKLLKNVDLFPVMIGMFQKEVADRIISDHGSKKYGILSVLAQNFYTGKQLIKISPGSFNPPPKVKSSIILLKRNEDYRDYLDLYKDLKTCVKIAFNQRRKMLRTSMKSLHIGEVLRELHMDDQRPAQLSLEDFRTLARAYQKSKNAS